MTIVDSENSRVSFATREPSLREQAPPSLRRAGPLRNQFEAARNERNTASQKDVRHRENFRGGSQMVKRQKPYPELKPKNSYCLKKATFNQEWLREQRVAQLEHLAAQRQVAPQQIEPSAPLWER